MNKDKIRTIITQDAEVDDQNSLRHFLLYANEVELLGIVQTSSVYHWIGVPGAATLEQKDLMGRTQIFDCSCANRWTGTDWMFRVLDDYEKVYPNLKRIDPEYPSPSYLRSITKIGNIGYPGEVEKATEGSELIRKAILDEDPRTLYLQVWGGCNTIARALSDIQDEFADTVAWGPLHERISQKVVITACGEQDNAYDNYIAQEWPEIPFVRCLQMGSYAYAWSHMPEGESKDTLRAAFMKENLLNRKGALMDGYAVWLDGKVYEGEGPENQFGSNPEILDCWWGGKIGLGPYEEGDFLSEGDSPTYFLLLNWGLRSLENFSYGGFSGRYVKDESRCSRKGEPLNYWIPQQDLYTDRGGNTQLTDSMWRYVADIQHDFAARADWCAADEGDEIEKAPALTVRGGVDRTARPGDTVRIGYAAKAGFGEDIAVSARIYEEASTVAGAPVPENDDEAGFLVRIPADAWPGQSLHVILQARNAKGHRLTHYQQVIVTIV